MSATQSLVEVAFVPARRQIGYQSIHRSRPAWGRRRSRRQITSIALHIRTTKVFGARNDPDTSYRRRRVGLDCVKNQLRDSWSRNWSEGQRVWPASAGRICL